MHPVSAQSDLIAHNLYYGDCLEVMKQWKEEQIDLIYLDPPFNSKANYNQLFGTENGIPAQVRAFNDTWKWDAAAAERYARISNAVAHPVHTFITAFYTIIGESGMLAYITYMAERLLQCRRILKKNGSIYLHCDPTASHYLKLMMDHIFGADNFRNEIVWCYTGPGHTKTWFPRKHDVILFYCKDNQYARPISNHVRIRYKKLNIQHREPGNTGIGGKLTEENIEIYRQKGKIPEDYWLEDRDHMTPVSRLKNERLGYPTQKPESLLTRIIKASSDEGDVILDPFCGCGTTIVVAEKLKRQWIGIDISPFATKLIRKRLKDESIPINGIPTDMQGAKMLLKTNPFDFEAWIVSCITGLAPNEKQSGDRGIDGRGKSLNEDSQGRNIIIAQVKGGGYTATALRDFLYVMQRENAMAGIFVTLNKVKAKSAATKAQTEGKYDIGKTQYPRLIFWSVEEYFENNLPNLPPMRDPYTGNPSEDNQYRMDYHCD